jgi:hypothetical protein
MPVLLINTKTIEEQLQQLEIHYLSNPEGQVYFAILSDWKDSNYKINAAGCDLLKIAKIGIEKLNISAEGWINGSDCNTLNLGNIWKDFTLPSNPTKCIRQSCMSSSDQRLTKFD